MEVPDLLVVTKADLGDVATRSRRDLGQALKAVGSPDVPGAGRLVGAAAERDRGARGRARGAPRERRISRSGACGPAAGAALREFTAEHGERALRDLGGRRAAERLLEEQDGGASVTELLARWRRARERGERAAVWGGRVIRGERAAVLSGRVIRGERAAEGRPAGEPAPRAAGGPGRRPRRTAGDRGRRRRAAWRGVARRARPRARPRDPHCRLRRRGRDRRAGRAPPTWASLSASVRSCSRSRWSCCSLEGDLATLMASTTACSRVRACSFVTALRTCARTVSAETSSWRATSSPGVAARKERRAPRARDWSAPGAARLHPWQGEHRSETPDPPSPVRTFRWATSRFLRSEDPRSLGAAHTTNGGSSHPLEIPIRVLQMAEELWQRVQGDGRSRAAQPAGAHLRPAGQAHRLQEAPRAAPSCEVDDLISCGIESFDTARSTATTRQGREPRGVPVDPHPRSGPRRAAPPRLGAALVAPSRARPPERAARRSPERTAARRRSPSSRT